MSTGGHWAMYHGRLVPQIERPPLTCVLLNFKGKSVNWGTDEVVFKVLAKKLRHRFAIEKSFVP